jgi:hypothetical protein
MMFTVLLLQKGWWLECFGVGFERNYLSFSSLKLTRCSGSASAGLAE